MTSLFQYLKKYKRLVFLHIICNVLLALFTVVSIPLLIPFFKILFDQERTPVAAGASRLEKWLDQQFIYLIDTYGEQQSLLIVCGAIVVVFFFKNFFRYLALYFITPVRNGIVYDVRTDIFDRLTKLPLSFFDRHKKGDLINRTTADVMEIEWSILNVLQSIFKAPIIILGCVIFMFSISTKLVMIGIVLMLVTGLVIGGVGRRLRAVSSHAQTTLASMTSTLEETLSGMRIIRAFNAEPYVAQRFDNDNVELRETTNRMLRRKDLSSPFSEFVGVSIVAVLLYAGTKLVLADEMNPETFFAFIFAFYQVIEPSKSFATSYYSVQKGLAAKDRIDHIIHHPLLKEVATSGSEAQFEQVITLSNLSMQYEDSSQYALNDISMEIRKGETIALVGPSGGGKTTLADVICRFYPYQKGSIMVDDTDFQSIDVKSWRDLIGLVNQEAILFNDSFTNNIHFSTKQVNQDEIRQAAKAADAQGFINGAANGYHTNIGDNGSMLSGGQRQRLTIARALYRDPQLLILDEATSSLDSAAETAVQQSLDHLMQGRTSIVIAHRLSTIKKADRIYVLDQGKIVDSGTHDELMARKSTYYNLVQMQTFTT